MRASDRRLHIARLEASVSDYPVLIFRDQDLSAPALAAFGRLFGPLEIYQSGAAKAAPPPLASLQERSARTTSDQMLYAHPEDSGVLIMTNEALSDLTAVAVIDNAECWHSDGSHEPEPYQAVAVHVVQNPASGGGDAEFCDLRLIYEALPAGDKKLLAGLTATHHWSKTLNPRFAGALDDAAREKGTRIAAAIRPCISLSCARIRKAGARRSTFRRGSPCASTERRPMRPPASSTSCSRSWTIRVFVIGTSGVSET